ncbi:MAG: autotransporter-associated beta strand repeat-containing protein, partial [Kiritimatiellaeota bacterium]|nr:autotransporter-associated beta strand repeat-containing protein [Kiritimatiellota bacterium]
AISGTGALVQNGSGTLTLNAANTYTGGTTISNGTLSVEVTANLGAAASGLTFSGGTLQITGTTLANFSGHTVTCTPAREVGLDINNAAHTFTVDQALNQTSGGFTKLGAGTAIL